MSKDHIPFPVPVGLSNMSDAILISPINLVSDSFDFFGSVNGETNVTLSRTNIAWNTDRTIRFQNPGKSPNISKSELANTVMPPNWPQDLSNINGGLQNESLIVWFRVSAFPWFRKLYGRPSVNGDQQGRLPKGEYTVFLTYSIFEYSSTMVSLGEGGRRKWLEYSLPTSKGLLTFFLYSHDFTNHFGSYIRDCVYKTSYFWRYNCPDPLSPSKYLVHKPCMLFFLQLRKHFSPSSIENLKSCNPLTTYCMV